MRPQDRDSDRPSLGPAGATRGGRGLAAETSLYLDVVRVCAVALVFVTHAGRPQVTDGFLAQLGQYGQEGVAAFFVISGVVIAYVADTRERSLEGYLVARLARLWSVVVPAVVLTVALDVLGRQINLPTYGDKPDWSASAAGVWQALSPMLFLNEVRPFDVQVGSNVAFWSLSYEAWYYVFFGLAFYLRGWRRLCAALAVVAFVRDPIVALAPVWLLGVAIYHGLGRRSSAVQSWLGWVLSLAAMVLLLAFKYRLAHWLEFHCIQILASREVIFALIEKYAFASTVALNILFFDRVRSSFGASIRTMGPVVRFVAGRSFSIYLYQVPIMVFMAAAVHGEASRPLRIAVIYAVTIGASLALAEVTERRKATVARWLRAVSGAVRGVLAPGVVEHDGAGRRTP